MSVYLKTTPGCRTLILSVKRSGVLITNISHGDGQALHVRRRVLCSSARGDGRLIPFANAPFPAFDGCIPCRPNNFSPERDICGWTTHAADNCHN